MAKKALHTRLEMWESQATELVAKWQRVEIDGFKLENPQHRKFWNKLKRSGKYHSSLDGEKAVFIPAPRD
jgi:hypothetical protein